MAITSANLLSVVKNWSCTCTLDGDTFHLDGQLPSRSIGFTQQRSTCSFDVIEYPDVTPGSDAEIYVTLNGETELFFRGLVNDRPIKDVPRQRTVYLVDRLKKLEKKTKTKITWNNRSFVDAVWDLFSQADISSGEVTSVYNPGSVYTLGPEYAIEIEEGETISSVLGTLMEFGGTALYTDKDGKIVVADYSGWPDDDATTVYAYGADRSLGEFGTLGSGKTIGGFEGVISSFRAKGPRKEDRTIPDAKFTLSGVTGDHEEEEYEWIQTEACAKAIAEREIVRRNRQYYEIQVEAPLNPLLRPGDSIQYRNSELGYDTNTPALIIGISTSHVTMTMVLSVGINPPEGSLSTIPAPTADFIAYYEQQPISLSGILAVRTLVQFTNTSSDASGFTIESYEWEFACSGDEQPYPDTSDEKDPAVVFPVLEGATARLIVESSSGEGGETTKPITPTEPERFTRALAVAAGDEGLWILAGTAGWRVFDAGTCTAVPNINDQGPLYAGFSSGELYKIEDYLATEPEVLHDFGAQINYIHVNDANPFDVLVAAGSTLYRSADGGESWLTIFDFTDDINYCENSPANGNEIRVCAGPSLYISFDGETFTPKHGPGEEPGAICRKVASAPWGHLIVWSGTVQGITGLEDERCWAFEEGYEIDWSGIIDPPIDLASCTPWQYSEGYVVASGDCSDLIRDGFFGQLTYIANRGPTTRLFLIKPDTSTGKDFVATEAATTIDSGPLKFVNHGSTFPICNALDAWRIGYGQGLAPYRPGEILLLPTGLVGSGDYLWWYQTDVGWVTVTLPLAGVAWRGIQVSPRNPNEWIIWTGGHVFWTGNAGTSWTQIYCPDPNSDLIQQTITGCSFSGDGSKWVLSAFYMYFYGANRSSQAYYVYGDAGSPNALSQVSYGAHIKNPAPSDGQFRLATKMIPGYETGVYAYGTLVGAVSPGFTYQEPETIMYIDTAAQTVTYPWDSPYVPQDMISNDTPNEALLAWGTNLGYVADYRTDEPHGIISAGSIAAFCYTLGVVAVGASGITHVAGFPDAPTTQIVAGGDDVYNKLVSGSRKQGVAAVTASRINGAFRCTSYNGLQWASVDAPAALTAIGAIALRETTDTL